MSLINYEMIYNSKVGWLMSLYASTSKYHNLLITEVKITKLFSTLDVDFQKTLIFKASITEAPELFLNFVTDPLQLF